jgi:hypothetical protein
MTINYHTLMMQSNIRFWILQPLLKTTQILFREIQLGVSAITLKASCLCEISLEIHFAA